MKPHYHVVQNVAGYLPESEPAMFDAKTEAQDYAQDLADEWRDAIATTNEIDPGTETRRVFGNKREGYVINDPNDPYTLPTYISISRCLNPNCAEEEN